MSHSSLDVTFAGEPQVWADIHAEIIATEALSAEELCTTTEARALRLTHLLEEADIMEKKHQKFQECLRECADDINADIYAEIDAKIIANYEDYLKSRPSQKTISALEAHMSKLLGLVAKQDVIAESRRDYLVERQKFSSDVDEWTNKIEVLRGKVQRG